MARRNIKVGRYFGIDVFLHYSWFFIFALLAWALSTGWFPQQFPGYSQGSYWVLGLFSAFLLFVSVLLHELSHSLVAIKKGMKVESITLFFFGGMAGMQEKKMSPKTEFQMAIAGPAMSLALSFVSLAVYKFIGFFYIAAVASYLYRINLILAIFNLVPGFPLDGGRIFRSVVWYWTKDFRKATQIAATGGKAFAYILIFAGFMNIFAANLGGVWFVLIGFFLLALSSMSYEQVVIKDTLTGRSVADFAVKRFASLKPDMTVRDAVREHFMKDDREMYPVIEKGLLKGIMTVEPIRKLEKESWKGKKISDLMIPYRKAPKARLTSSSYSALIKMMRSGLGAIPVTDGKKTVGVVKRDDILRYVKLKTAEEKYKKMGFDIK